MNFLANELYISIKWKEGRKEGYPKAVLGGSWGPPAKAPGKALVLSGDPPCTTCLPGWKSILMVTFSRYSLPTLFFFLCGSCAPETRNSVLGVSLGPHLASVTAPKCGPQGVISENPGRPQPSTPSNAPSAGQCSHLGPVRPSPESRFNCNHS